MNQQKVDIKKDHAEDKNGAEIRTHELEWCFAMFRFWFGFIFFYSPDPPQISTLQKKTGSKIGRKCPYLQFVFGLGLVYWVSEWTNNLVGQENPSCPGRMNTSPEQETRIVYVTYVRTANSSREKGGSSRDRWFSVTPSYLTKGRPMR